LFHHFRLYYLDFYVRSVLSISTSTTNKIDRYDITDILLKVALNTITLIPLIY